MKIQRIKTNIFDKAYMCEWRKLNGIPEYINASYKGYTGGCEYPFPTTKNKYCFYPDITNKVKLYEEEILQELKDTREKPFGYLRALWLMSQKLGTGEPWDSKFMPQFPGRNKKGQVQFANYNNTVVSANDLSNIIYGHICAYMDISKGIAKLAARLDACGITEIITKKRLPNMELMRFKDTPKDQLAIEKGLNEFNIKSYRLK